MSNEIVEVVRPVVGYEVGDRHDVDTAAEPWVNMLDSGLIAVVEGAASLDHDGAPNEQPGGDASKPATSDSDGAEFDSP